MVFIWFLSGGGGGVLWGRFIRRSGNGAGAGRERRGAGCERRGCIVWWIGVNGKGVIVGDMEGAKGVCG